MATIKLVSGIKRSADGRWTLRVRVNVGDTIAYASTDIKLLDDEWDSGSCEYKGQSDLQRARVIALRSNLAVLLAELKASGRLPRLKALDIANIIRVEVLRKSPRSDPRSLLIKRMEAYRDKCSAEGTMEVYQRTIDTLIRFDDDIASRSLERVDRKYLEDFERFCRKTMSVNTTSILLRNIRRVFNYAKEDGITTNYPFAGFKIKQEETPKRCLSFDKLRQLMMMNLPESQARYRDYFMLMFYLIGVNSADLFNAKPEALKDGRLNFRRKKTGKLYSVKVEPEAMAIIERYRGKDHLLEAMDNHKNFLSWRTQLNKRLKALGQPTGKRGKVIGEGPFPDLSTYWTRHTWSTLSFQIGIPIDTIAQALGHSDRTHSVTMIYIKTDQNRVDKANRRLIDYVNGISPSGNRTQDDK